MMSTYEISGYDHNPERSIEWLVYSASYLFAAKAIAEQDLSAQKADGGQDARDRYLIPPLMYNLRHGIELLLKGLSLAASVSTPRTHDISKLFVAVNEVFLELEPDVIEEVAGFLEVEQGVVRIYLQDSLQKLEQIVIDYYGYGFLLKDEAIVTDRKNELFRYPVTISDNVTLTAFDIIQSRLDTSLILEEVDLIQRFTFSCIAIFGRTYDGSWLLSA